jgi:peptidoglycan-N-acetylglucosamine deacetylase
MRSARSAARRAASWWSDRLFGALESGPVDRPWVALTFDDGPHPVTTPLVLEALARHGAVATFFMVGREALAHPDLVAAVAAAGHAIGHHTLDHVSLPGLAAGERRRQISGGYEAVGPTGLRLFRPPYGHLDPPTWLEARRQGHEVVAWSHHAFDWTAQDDDTLTRRLAAALVPGAIVLLHDAPQRTDPHGSPRVSLVHALERVLADAGSAWRFVTVPDLLAAGRCVRRTRWRSEATPDPTPPAVQPGPA